MKHIIAYIFIAAISLTSLNSAYASEPGWTIEDHDRLVRIVAKVGSIETAFLIGFGLIIILMAVFCFVLAVDHRNIKYKS